MAVAGLALLVATAVVAAAWVRRPDRSVEAFCERLRPVQALDEVLAEGDAGRAGEQVGLLRELQVVAPEDVESAVGRLVAVTDEVARALSSAENPHGDAHDVFARRQAEISDIVAAGESVERFASAHCGVRLGEGGQPPAPATSTPTIASTPSAPPPSTAVTSTTSTTSTTKAAARATSSTRRAGQTTRAAAPTRPPTTRATTRSTAVSRTTTSRPR